MKYLLTRENHIVKTLGQILQGKNMGLFISKEGEYCRIHKNYVGNTQHFSVIFSKTDGEIATRYAIKTTSEKKILKLINDEQFELVVKA